MTPRQFAIAFTNNFIPSTLISLVLVARDIKIAHMFGVSSSVDHYLFVLILTAFIINLASGALISAALPRIKSAPETEKGTLKFLCLVIIALAIVSLFFNVGISAFKFSDQSDYLFAALAAAAYCCVEGFSQLLRGLLNLRHRFFTPTLVMIISPLFSIVALYTDPLHLGVFSTLLGLVIGSLIQFIILHRMLFSNFDFIGLFQSHLPGSWKSIASDIWNLSEAAIWLYGIQVSYQLLASNLGSEQLSTLSYGLKLSSFLSATVGFALTTVLLPMFLSNSAGANFKKFFGLTFVLSALLCLPFIFFSKEIITLIFAHGNFQLQDVHPVSNVNQLALLQIPSYFASLVGVRYLQARMQTKVVLRIARLLFLISLPLFLILTNWFGVNGIALSLVVIYTLSATFVFYKSWCLSETRN